MAVYILTSDGVPGTVLSGTAGAMIGLLDHCLVTTAGWTKSNTGVANMCTYQAPAGKRFWLGVDDTAAQSTMFRGYTSAPTAGGVVSTLGTGPFPTNTQGPNGNYVYKSAAASTLARGWRFASDGKMFYLFVNAGAGYSWFSFGDFISNAAVDSYNVLNMGESTANAITAGAFAMILASSAGVVGNYLARPYNQAGSSRQCGKLINAAFGHTASDAIGSTGANYPSPVEGALLTCTIDICEGTNGVIRGRMPGVLAPMHPRPLADLDAFAGTGDLTGKSFVAWNLGSTGQVLVETTDTWAS